MFVVTYVLISQLNTHVGVGTCHLCSVHIDGSLFWCCTVPAVMMGAWYAHGDPRTYDILSDIASLAQMAFVLERTRHWCTAACRWTT